MIALLLACSPAPPDDTSPAEIDERITEADFGALASGQQVWWGADFVVEPGQDVMMCMPGTYEGDDAGMVSVQVYQGEYGHHLQLMGTTLPSVDVEDGAAFDCTLTQDLPMESMEPLGLPTESNRAAITVPLPEGFAIRLNGRQRWVLQSHYVNTGTEPMHVRDAAVITTVPEDEVETWANMIAFNRETFEVPPHDTASVSFDCEVTSDVKLLALFGHMHEWGQTFSTDLVQGDTVTRLYEVPDWDASMRDQPPMVTFAEEEYGWTQGTQIRTNCTWNNDTDEPLTFPHEMCTTTAIAYPLQNSMICSQ